VTENKPTAQRVRQNNVISCYRNVALHVNTNRADKISVISVGQCSGSQHKPCQNSPSNWSLLRISFISLALGGDKIWRKQCEASRATDRHVFLFFASFTQIDVCIQKVSNHRITPKWRKMVTLIGFLQKNILKIQSVFL